MRRRNFLALGSATAALWSLGFTSKANGVEIAQDAVEEIYPLPPLPYAYNALEPYIDAETMRFHHDQHHASYTRKLNAAVSQYPQLQQLSPEELLRNLNTLPDDIRTTVRNNGGGYVNHKMFWEIMSPDGGGEPTGAITTVINQTFGSFEQFKQQLNATGKGQFGSGWAWLVRSPEGKLQVLGTPNQDSPLMMGMYPIIGVDVWEHAYYLKYRNQRGEYLNQWWNVANWEEINNRYEQAIAV